MPMDDISDKPINLESLEMAKKRNKKVYIHLFGIKDFRIIKII